MGYTKTSGCYSKIFRWLSSAFNGGNQPDLPEKALPDMQAYLLNFYHHVLYNGIKFILLGVSDLGMIFAQINFASLAIFSLSMWQTCYLKHAKGTLVAWMVHFQQLYTEN